MNRELVFVGLGLLAMTVHSIDESVAFGAPSGPPWVIQAGVIVVLLSMCAVHPRLGAWRLVPAALVVLLGAFTVRTGWEAHVRPLLEHGPGPTDATGVLFSFGGVLLVAAGVLLLGSRTSVIGGLPSLPQGRE